MTKSSNTQAIERATGVRWEEWVAYLDGGGGREAPHRDLAVRAAERLAAVEGNIDWWAQGVAVAYEQHIGRRHPGQAGDGSFQVGVSKTFAGTMDEAMDAWCALVAGADAFGGVPAEREPERSATGKWRYWRVPLADGSRVSLDVHSKAPGKAGLGINHRQLGSQEAADHWRAVWKGMLGRL